MGSSFFLSEELQGYLRSSMTPLDDVLADLRDETEKSLRDVAQMQIAPEQGAFLTTLASVDGSASHHRGRHLHRLQRALPRPRHAHSGVACSAST